MLSKLFDSKDRVPPPPLPPEYPSDAAPVASEEVYVVDSSDEPELSEPLTTEIVEVYDEDPALGGPVSVEPASAPDPLNLRAQRIAAEIEEMMGTAQAEAVEAATAPLEKTIAQLHGDLDALHADLGQLRTVNNELRDRLAQIHAASA